MRTFSVALLVALLCACERKTVSDPGPRPPADHQDQLRTLMHRVLRDDTARYRFAAPVRDRLPRNLVNPNVPGQPPRYGQVHGWRVDVFVTTKDTAGETPYIAFFHDGRFAGIFGKSETQHASPDADEWTALFLPSPPR
ncbi:MAG TPA: hypothetical protein VF384_16830 [Planctomycetota bacterium]